MKYQIARKDQYETGDEDDVFEKIRRENDLKKSPPFLEKKSLTFVDGPGLVTLPILPVRLFSLVLE